jgi:hypothetical protein
MSRKRTFAEIGRNMGGMTTSASSRNSGRLAEKLEKDPSLRRRFEKLNCVWGGIF